MGRPLPVRASLVLGRSSYSVDGCSPPALHYMLESCMA